MLLRGLILVAALGLTAPGAQSSTLVPADLRIAGDNLLTIDTATGLVWLDLTETAGQSFNQIKAQLGLGGALQGFRFATLSEVVELWSNAGIDPSGLPSPAPSFANFAPIIAFQALVGLTDPNPFAHDSIGLVDDTDFFGDHPIPFARAFFQGPFAGQGLVTASSARSPDQAFFNHGSWLVQGTPPPDPGTLAFTSFRVRDFQSTDRLRFLADFKLRVNTNGINPSTEQVTVRLFTAAGDIYNQTLNGFSVKGQAPRRRWLLNDSERARTGIERFEIDEDPSNSGTIFLRDVNAETGNSSFDTVRAEIVIGTGAAADKLTGAANLIQKPVGSGKWRFVRER